MLERSRGSGAPGDEPAWPTSGRTLPATSPGPGTPTDSFDYDLPPGAIAQQPAEHRSQARLLVALGDEELRHCTVEDLPSLLGPGDCLVLNETRVQPARLHLRKSTGAAIEVLLLAPADSAPGWWEALVRPGRRVRPGQILLAPQTSEPVLEIGGEAPGGTEGVRLVRLIDPRRAEALGELPLPPYLTGSVDPERYQTVYARLPGSVAAPTAGLHLTEELVERCRDAGATVVTIDLSVGLGTFRPISAALVEAHQIHPERYRVPQESLRACREARRVVAVGTTTLRALETVAAGGPLEGSSTLYVHGDYPFGLVDVLLTNFHLPRSSLLVLLESFAGARWRPLYETALAAGYRFLSLGDAMLVDRRR